MNKTFYIISILFLASCNNDMKSNSAEYLINTSSLENSECSYGGLLIQTGLDKDHNQVLSDTEVNNEKTQCFDPPQSSSSITTTQNVSSGSLCIFGGSEVFFGFDENENSTLELNEINNSTVICQENLIRSIVDQLPLATSSCIHGGLSVNNYLDANNNNEMDLSEKISHEVHCYTYPSPPTDEDLTVFLNRMRLSEKITHELKLLEASEGVSNAMTAAGFYDFLIMTINGQWHGKRSDQIAEFSNDTGSVKFVEYLKNNIAYGLYNINNFSEIAMEINTHKSSESLPPQQLRFKFRNEDFSIKIFPYASRWDVEQYEYMIFIVPEDPNIIYEQRFLGANNLGEYETKLKNTEMITQYRAISFISTQPVSNLEIYQLVEQMFID